MTQFLILSFVRALFVTGLLSYLTSSILKDRARRLACTSIAALGFGAIMDGITPDGWEFEFAFGHPIYFYLLANTPAVLAALVVLLLWPRPAAPDDTV